MPPAIGEEFHRKKQQIRDFCKRATNSGGVLLVTGTRGVGKTRLVDEALNERDKIDACRYETPRLPRDVKRFIIRVDVDPNFPNPKPEANSTDDAPPDENTLAFILIRNIIFALTSTLDSRFSLRKHGKTLYARLGFWNYWFAPNGLMLTGYSKMYFMPIAYSFLAAFVLMYSYLLYTPLIPASTRLAAHLPIAWLIAADKFILSIWSIQVAVALAILVAFLSTLFAWLLLRLLDLRAFAFISADLYDLAHAQEKTKNHSDNREDKSEMTSKLPWLLVGIVLICVAVNPDLAKPLIKPLIELMPQESTSTSDAATPSKQEQSDKNAKQTQGDPPETSPHEDHLTRVQALILSAGLLITILVTRTHSQNKQDRADFGTNNPVWMITLLRRYLYTCHRCGIEPVLVLDELDKLEDIEYWVKHKVKDKDQEKEKPGLTKLGMFLMALARLKSSLGAEFLWVLVSGSRLYSYLQEDRHDCKNGALGLLATVIHQDITLGPTDYETAATYFDDLDEKIKKNLWLRSRGNFASMIRNHEANKNLSSTPFVNKLADAVIGIWSPDTQLVFLKPSPTRLVKQQLHAEWVQIWIHAGILEIANRLTKQQFNYAYFDETLPQAVYDKYGDKGEIQELEITALFSEQPELLTLLGERLFFAYLNRCEFLNDPHSDLNLGSVLSFKPDFYR